MNEEPRPLELSSFARLGAFLLFTTGIAGLFAAGQVWWVVIFPNPWQEALPLIHMGAGLAAIVLSIHLNHPRRWALFLTIPVLAVLGCGGVPWTIWL